MVFNEMDQLVNVSSLIQGLPSEHFENEESNIRYNDQYSELDEVERCFSEMNEVNHVTC